MDTLLSFSIMVSAFGLLSWVLGLSYRHFAAELVGFWLMAVGGCAFAYWAILWYITY